MRGQGATFLHYSKEERMVVGIDVGKTYLDVALGLLDLSRV